LGRLSTSPPLKVRRPDGHQCTKPLDLPPDVAKAFAADMRAFLVEKSAMRRNELTAHSSACFGSTCTAGLARRTLKPCSTKQGQDLTDSLPCRNRQTAVALALRAVEDGFRDMAWSSVVLNSPVRRAAMG
jgi:hypothetical protein